MFGLSRSGTRPALSPVSNIMSHSDAEPSQAPLATEIAQPIAMVGKSQEISPAKKKAGRPPKNAPIESPLQNLNEGPVTEAVATDILDPVPAPAPAAPAFTRESLNTALKAVAQKFHPDVATKGMEKVREILGVYGYKRLSEVKEEDFQKVQSAAQDFLK